MGLLSSLDKLLFPDPPKAWGSEFVRVQERATVEDLANRMLGRFRVSSWTPATVREALSVPAIYAAVTLISNTVGSLTLRAFRNGVAMPDGDRPRLIVRPNPFTTPRDFFRDTAYSMATRGEAWWWIAARDTDNSPLSLIPVNPVEITVHENDKDLRFPVIEWRGREMRNEDMVQITLQRDLGDLRGKGPLQLAGAAVSVGVEAMEFAANFYGGGGYPSVHIKKAGQLDPTKRDEFMQPDPAGLSEADALRAQWVDRPNNVPRVTDDSISVDKFEPDAAKVQMVESRVRSDVEAAQLFNLPAPMIEAAVAGSSLTYQNISGLFDNFVRRCLRPNYLEPIEQAMSDLLTRSTVARFNTTALTQDNLATRADIYTKLVPLGVYDVEEARSEIGLSPGDVENAPVPLAVPQAIPTSLPIQQRSGPEPIVTKEQVLTAREQLRLGGHSHGYASIARVLNVSEATVRRRLAA